MAREAWALVANADFGVAYPLSVKPVRETDLID
jgi:hypothetical protein